MAPIASADALVSGTNRLSAMGVGARLGDIRAPPEGLESCVLIKPQHKRLLSCDVVQWLSHLGVAGKSCQAKKKKKKLIPKIIKFLIRGEGEM